MTVTRAFSLLFAAAMLACGGGGDDDGGTTNPPPPPPGNTQTLGSITTNVTTMNIAAGATQTITVSAFDTQNAAIANPGIPTFATTNATVAEVDNAGVVLGLGVGTATIQVSLTRQGVTKTASVTVNVSGTLPASAQVLAGADIAFTPKRVAIARNGSVTWNFGSLEHTVSFTGGTGAPNSILSGGLNSSISRTFTNAGNFSYICTIHAGMNGEVIVR